MTDLKPNEAVFLFQCACCKGIFENDTPEEEALAELEQNFPGTPVEECDMVCDDCFRGTV